MKNRNEMLGNEKINKLLFKLSLPATIGMLVNALYNIVDTIFIGRGVGKLGITGLTIALPIQMIILSLGLMIGIGAASAVSRSLGEENIERADHIAGNAFLSILIVSVFMSVLSFIFIEPLLITFGATKNSLPYALEYMQIILIGAIYFPFVMAANNLVRSEGNAKVSMYVMLIGTVLNIILDPIFIFVLDLGIRGAALATIISQFASFIYVILYFLLGKSTLKIKLHHFKPDFKIIWEIVTVGFASFARNVSGSILAIVINNSLKLYGGDTAIAIYGVISKVLIFLLMPLFGVVQGMQPIAGFNYGAKKYTRVREVVKLSVTILTLISSLGSLLCIFLPNYVMRLFTDDLDLITQGSSALQIVLIAIPVIGIQIVGATLFQALGKAWPSLILSLLRQVLLLIPLVLLLPLFMSNKLLAVWVAFPISDFISTIITIIMVRKLFNSLILPAEADPAIGYK